MFGVRSGTDKLRRKHREEPWVSDARADGNFHHLNKICPNAPDINMSHIQLTGFYFKSFKDKNESECLKQVQKNLQKKKKIVVLFSRVSSKSDVMFVFYILR